MEQFEADISAKSLRNEADRGASNILKMTGGHVATLIVLAISGLIIPRVLGADKFGLYAAVIAVISIMQSISSLGLNQVTVRYLGSMWMLQNKSEVINLGSSILAARMILSVVAGVITTFWLFFSSKLELTFLVCVIVGLLCLVRSTFNSTRLFFLPLGHPGKMVSFEVIRVSIALPLVILFFIWFGLSGIFFSLTISNAVLFLICLFFLLRIIPLRWKAVSWAALRPFIRFSILTYVGLVSVMVQNQFSVYFVATMVTQQQAAFLAIAINLYTIIQNLIGSAGNSLIPIMAEIHDQDQLKRLGYWGGLVMRYSAVVTVIIVVSWVLLGEHLIRWILTTSFMPVFPVATLIFISTIFLSCAGACNTILFIKNMAGVASANRLVFGVTTIIGLFIVINSKFSSISYSISWVYVVAALIFWCCSYLTLGFFGKLWLPLPRTLFLILPAFLFIWIVYGWVISFWIKLILLIVFLLFYGLLAVGFRLLPFYELKEIFNIFIKQRRLGSKKS